MSNFVITKFKNFATINAGQSPESIYYSDSEGTPFLQGNRTFGILHPEIDTYTKKITKIASIGDILMSVRAPVGDLNFANRDICIGRGIAGIKAIDGNNKFLFYCLKYNIQNLIRQGSGTTYDSVNKDIINDFDLIMPKDQKTRQIIGKVLSDLDAKIELNNKINAELEAMAKTLYDYWFVQFDFPDVHGKPYKSSGGKMVWNEELKREIPEGWTDTKIGNISELIRGVSYDKTQIEESLDDENIRILRATNLSGNKIDLNNPVLISKKLVDEKQLLRKYDILLTMSSGSIDHIGKNGFYYFDEEVSFGAFCAKLIPYSNYSYYLYQFMQSEHLNKLIKNECLGTNINNLNSSMVKGFKLVNPDNEILKKFERINKSLFSKIEINTIENQHLASLRDWLLPMLMNGQVTVGDAPRQAQDELGMVAEPGDNYKKI